MRFIRQADIGRLEKIVAALESEGLSTRGAAIPKPDRESPSISMTYFCVPKELADELGCRP